MAQKKPSVCFACDPWAWNVVTLGILLFWSLAHAIGWKLLRLDLALLTSVVWSATLAPYKSPLALHYKKPEPGVWVHTRKAEVADTGKVEVLKELKLKQELFRLWERIAGWLLVIKWEGQQKGEDFRQRQEVPKIQGDGKIQNRFKW